MNDNLNDIIWEEKNSTEPQNNYENKSVLEIKDITNDIQKNVENLHWKDITDPKLRLKAYKKAYHQANKNKIKSQNKAYRENNKDKIRVEKKVYYDENKDRLKVIKKNYYNLNKEKIKIKQKIWRNLNKDKKKDLDKSYRENNKDKKKSLDKAWRDSNRDKIKTYNDSNKDKRKAWHDSNKDKINSYFNNRRKTDIQFKLSHNLRARLNSAIKGNYKVGSAVKDLGCSIEELKSYIESKFQPGMSWDNWSKDGWHIDHIKPLASFNLTDRNQLLEACHYTNLQPLWAIDNLSKRDNII